MSASSSWSEVVPQKNRSHRAHSCKQEENTQIGLPLKGHRGTVPRPVRCKIATILPRKMGLGTLISSTWIPPSGLEERFRAPGRLGGAQPRAHNDARLGGCGCRHAVPCTCKSAFE